MKRHLWPFRCVQFVQSQIMIHKMTHFIMWFKLFIEGYIPLFFWEWPCYW